MGHAKYPDGQSKEIEGAQISFCSHCRQYAFWMNGQLVLPEESSAPHPNPDLPEEIRIDFEEARQIIHRSPRGATALLRICIQKLCKHLLGERSQGALNADIAALVADGLNPKIQKSLDTVRVIGHNASEPGALDRNGSSEVAMHLCKVINIIAETLITQPKMVDEMYELLPEKETFFSLSKQDDGLLAAGVVPRVSS